MATQAPTSPPPRSRLGRAKPLIYAASGLGLVAVAARARRRGGFLRGGAATIETLRDMRLAELQELYSAEQQLGMLLPVLISAATDPRLRIILSECADETNQRLDLLRSHIGQLGANPRAHPDQAMRALTSEARKMTKVSMPTVRDAGLIASMQRLLHYRIAVYGTVAAYARALGETYHAGALADYSNRDKLFDERLTELAEAVVNPSADIEEP